jgi:hypothetical protein
MNSSSHRDPPPLTSDPVRFLDGQAGPISSYITSQEANADRAVDLR